MKKNVNTAAHHVKQNTNTATHHVKKNTATHHVKQNKNTAAHHVKKNKNTATHHVKKNTAIHHVKQNKNTAAHHVKKNVNTATHHVKQNKKTAAHTQKRGQTEDSYASCVQHVQSLAGVLLAVPDVSRHRSDSSMNTATHHVKNNTNTAHSYRHGGLVVKASAS